MLKKSITYTNPFTDEEMTEEHYFHISKADVVEMEMEEHNQQYKAKDGQDYTGMQAKLMMIIDSEDGKAILTELKDIIRRSYGQKVGDRFIKSPEAWAEFSGSEAFSQLLFELCTDAEAAAGFMNGVIPKNLAAEAANIAAMQSAENKVEITDEQAEPVRLVTPLHQMPQGSTDGVEATLEREPKTLTVAEAQAMDQTELQSGLASGRYQLS